MTPCARAKRPHKKGAPGRTAALAAVLALAAGAASAAGNLLLLDPPPERDTLAVGGSVWSLPKYPGARGSDRYLLPAFDWSSRSGWFVSTDSGVGWNLSTTKELQMGFRLWPQFGRSLKGGPAGLSSIGWRPQLQGFANLEVGGVALLQSGVLYGAGRDRDGVQVELGVTSGIPLGATQIGVGVSTTWANRAFRDSYFGISAAESRSSGLPAFAPGAGMLDSALTLSLEHKFNAQWKLSGQWVLSRYASSVARSPLVQERRPAQGQISLWYSL